MQRQKSNVIFHILPEAKDLYKLGYNTKGSSGIDIYSVKDYILSPYNLYNNKIEFIETGIISEFPEGYEFQIRPRSGLSCRCGIIIPNSPGTIDSDYRGEWKVALLNLSNEKYVVKRGHRIAQAVFCKIEKLSSIIMVDYKEGSIPDTERGSGGFGSTGI